MTNIQASTVSVIGEELAVSVNSSARVTDVGLNVSFGARASGGLPPLVYSYAWTFGDGGTIGVTGNATIHRFQGTASHTVMVIATGTDGFSVANSTTVIVNARPVVSTPARFGQCYGRIRCYGSRLGASRDACGFGDSRDAALHGVFLERATGRMLKQERRENLVRDDDTWELIHRSNGDGLSPE